MDAESFQRLEIELEALTSAQRETVLARMHGMAERDNNQRVIEERLGKQMHCPRCSGDKVVKFGQTNGQQRYRCNSCRRTFIALTGTPFLYLHAKSKLMAYAGCMAEGLTIRKSAERAGLTVDRAFRWRHTFLAYLQQQKPSGLTGVVEADETCFLRSCKVSVRPPHLDDDSEPDSAWLQTLVERADGAENAIGMFASKVLARCRCHLRSAGHSLVPWGKPDRAYKQTATAALPSGEPLCPCHAGALLRWSMVEEILTHEAFLDDDIERYWTCLDAGIKAQILGWRCEMVHEAVVVDAGFQVDRPSADDTFEEGTGRMKRERLKNKRAGSP